MIGVLATAVLLWLPVWGAWGVVRTEMQERRR